MAQGPGKYDEMAELVRERTKAEHVLVIVINGDKGTSYALHIGAHSMQEAIDNTERMAKALRQVADTMDADVRRMRGTTGN